MLRSGWVHRLPCFNANAAAGLSSSQPGRGHARPPQLCLPEVAMPAASMAPQQLRWHDHPVSAPRAVETCWPRTAVGARADKQAIYTPRVTPGELGSGQQLGRKSGLETPSHRGGGIKLCSDTRTLQNSENEGEVPTPKPEVMPQRAWARLRGAVNRQHPSDCPIWTQLKPQWGSSGSTSASECCCRQNARSRPYNEGNAWPRSRTTGWSPSQASGCLQEPCRAGEARGFWSGEAAAPA